ncbi:4'-phosphopantetheinyl transferase family protein [Marinobacterium jannaschii]|uniref:4'-phosphopantetheinyl transferase family protein n=1 Tax=Marinobacterium jannaschii TaxID=64970 RepID=UPI000685DC0A|nr:4'-phosphopantetheinyl transferase superfamily protein [Marinobacterium jannaschii]
MTGHASFITSPQAIPEPGPLQFWHCRFDPGLYRPGDEQCLGIELPEKLASALAKRRVEYIAGRCCARAALSAAGLADAVPGYNSDRSPHWPAGVQGSISHSDGVAVAAVLRDAYMGIDLETLVSADTAASVAGMILTPAEQLRYGARPDPLILTLIFSLKESFYKAAYPQVGRFFDFTVLSVTAIDPARQQISFRLEQSLSPALQAGLTLRAYWLEMPNTQYLTYVTLERACSADRA